jgi:acetyltransferase-like isoleucine patch superfamily enzyme
VLNSVRQYVRPRLGRLPLLKHLRDEVLESWQAARLREFGFADVGAGVSIARGCEVHGAGGIIIGDGVRIQRWTRLILPGWHKSEAATPRVMLDEGCDIGESCTISAITKVHIQRNVLFGCRVWITDHNHIFQDVTSPILSQGCTLGGHVTVGENSWVGTGAVIIGAKGLTIGRGCVIGANAVVVQNVPDHCVVVGNPARIVRRFDAASEEWRRFDDGQTD